MRKKFCSITVKYIVSVMCIVLLFTVLVSTIWSSMYKNQIWSSIAELVNEMIYSSNTAFDKTLQDINYNITFLNLNSEFQEVLGKGADRTNPEILKDRKTMDNLLSITVNTTMALKEVSVVQKNGAYYQSGTIEKSDEELERYERLLDEGNEECVYLAETHRYEKTNIDMLMVKRLNSGKKTEALVIATIDCSTLWKEYSEKLNAEFGFAVYDQHTKTLVKEEKLDEINYEKNVQWEKDISNIIGSYAVEKINGKEYMTMYYESSRTGWRTVIYIPSSELDKRYLNGTYLNYLIIGFTIIAAACVSFIVVRVLTKDLKRLTNIVKNLDSVSLEIPEEKFHNDEVEILFDRFCQMVNRVRIQMKLVKEKEKEKRLFEIKALQAQINPHFLHNSLSTIKYLAEIQRAENIIEVTDSLSQIMQVNMSEKRYITLEEEKRYLENYIRMKEYQYARNISFTMEIEKGLESYLILKLLIQPLVENSLKHGEIMEKTDGYISVNVYKDVTGIGVLVRDNGKGMSVEKIQESKAKVMENESIGLFNIEERIRLNYGEPYGMEIDSEPGRYTVIILKLPEINGSKKQGE